MYAYPAKPSVRILRRDGKTMPVVDVLELYTYLRSDETFLRRAGKYPIFENSGLVKGKHFVEGITSFWITQEGFHELTKGSTNPKVQKLSQDFSEALERYEGRGFKYKVLRHVHKILDRLFPDKPE